MQNRDASASERDSGAFGSTEEQSGVRESKGKAKRVRVIEHPTWLSNRDQDDLRRYYRNGGSSATTRSTTAACLAIIEQRSRIAIPCVRCGGDVEKGLGGTGFIDSETGLAPGAQRVTSPVSLKQAELLGLLDLAALVDGQIVEKTEPEPEAKEAVQEGATFSVSATTTGTNTLAHEWKKTELLPVAFGDQLCPECDGRCWIVGGAKPAKKPEALFPAPPGSPFRVTRAAVPGLPNVWPMAAEDAPGGYEMSEQMHSDLGLLARVSRRIRTLLEMTGGEAAVEALGCYYAPDGGTIAALWHLVPAGKKLLRNNPQKLHPSQLFANLRNEQAEKHDPNRQLLFEAADKQSLKLFELACELWNIAGPPPEDRAGKHLDAIEAALTSWGAAAARVLRQELQEADTEALREKLKRLSDSGHVLIIPEGSEIRLIRPNPPEFEHDPSGGPYLGGPIIFGRAVTLSPKYREELAREFEESGMLVGLVKPVRMELGTYKQPDGVVFAPGFKATGTVEMKIGDHVVSAEMGPGSKSEEVSRELIAKMERMIRGAVLGEDEPAPVDAGALALEREQTTARFSEAMLAYDGDAQAPCDDPSGGEE